MGLATRLGRQTFCAVGRRRGWRVPSAAACLGIALASQGAEIPLSETNLLADTPSLWTESMLWDKQISVSSGFGYKDNVLLSAFRSQGSAFLENGLDCALIRVPLDGWQVVASLSGDYTWYWHDPGTSSEDSCIASLQVTRELSAGWKAILELRGLQENQVLDVSTQPGQPSAVLVAGESCLVQPALRKDLDSGLWLKLGLPISRWWLETPLDDYSQYGPVVTIGYDAGKRTEFTLSYGASYEHHDTWTPWEYPDGEVALPQKLEIFQNRVEFDWRQYWDDRQHWRSATQLIFASLTDNGGGYFNEYQYQVIQDLRWQAAGWMIKASAGLTCEDYPVQLLTGYRSGPTLYRNLWDLSGEVDRQLAKALTIYAKVDCQRAISNETQKADDYHATTVSGGLRWEF